VVFGEARGEAGGPEARRLIVRRGLLGVHVGHEQEKALRSGIPLKMIETGHIACTVKESILEKAFDLGEKFVQATQKLPKNLDPSGKGIIGPFALQGAVVAAFLLLLLLVVLVFLVVVLAFLVLVPLAPLLVAGAVRHL
jgi:5-formaminoimidazole-4-carboxamide-1-(beta)-D-ribofuranosyl 5'-monophosphate synthetase